MTGTEGQENWIGPTVLPNLTNVVRIKDACEGRHYPVLIVHRIKLKTRPFGYLTPSSNLKFTDLTYQRMLRDMLFDLKVDLSQFNIDSQHQVELINRFKKRSMPTTKMPKSNNLPNLKRKRKKVCNKVKQSNTDVIEPIKRLKTVDIAEPLSYNVDSRERKHRMQLNSYISYPAETETSSSESNSAATSSISTEKQAEIKSNHPQLFSVAEQPLLSPTKLSPFQRQKTDLYSDSPPSNQIQHQMECKNNANLHYTPDKLTESQKLNVEIAIGRAPRIPQHLMPDLNFHRKHTKHPEITLKPSAKKPEPLPLPEYSMDDSWISSSPAPRNSSPHIEFGDGSIFSNNFSAKNQIHQETALDLDVDTSTPQKTSIMNMFFKPAKRLVTTTLSPSKQVSENEEQETSKESGSFSAYHSTFSKFLSKVYSKENN